MHVLFVTHRYPPHTGGVETHVQEIARRLADSGHGITVFSADAGPDVTSKHMDNGIRVRRFRSVSHKGAFYVAPQLILAVRRANADVVHAHNYHAFPLFFAALGVTDERFIVTTHYHGESASEARDVLLSLYRPFGRWAVEKADKVITVSEWERERLQENLGVDAIVIPNGVDVGRFANAKPERRERPYLLCVGRLEKYKGVQHVIRGLTELPEYDLVVAGSGPYLKELERIARKEGVADRVDFLGYVGDDRLPRLYAGAEVYVTMSEFEAYGMTVAEALAAGTPCVLREAGALEDWIDYSLCIGVPTIESGTIARRVNKATELKSPDSRPPTWDSVTDRVQACYG